MDSDTLWGHIDRERAWIADLLDSLPEESWEVQSLCSGWTVRDVAAHLTCAHSRMRDILWPAIRTGFRYNAMIDHAAVHSPLTHDEIVAKIRSFVGSRRKAPMISDYEPLIDTLVHVQDICQPLGIDHKMPPDAAAAAADRVLNTPWPLSLWKPEPGVRLVATDVDWSYGDGTVLRAPIQHLLLTLTGRSPTSAQLGRGTATPI
ncbi:maleylpyruvate isomerase family mycothiol-dependent enzyme [Nocardioides bigeumensis]|uniref:Maleylpyruvate isomerase family mycothiol-dependent enzyme n=1 Tax=Nocardioides bigeumensis TaxID=433657 RepID=A0ABN2XJV1_9ACTN